MSLYDIRYRTKGRVVCDNKRNASGLACGLLTGFKCFVACDSMNSLDFLSEKRKVVSTIVKVLDEFIGSFKPHLLLLSDELTTLVTF